MAVAMPQDQFQYWILHHLADKDLNSTYTDSAHWLVELCLTVSDSFHFCKFAEYVSIINIITSIYQGCGTVM
jgi:hypothetical protein